jgi:hypothetical protein
MADSTWQPAHCQAKAAALGLAPGATPEQIIDAVIRNHPHPLTIRVVQARADHGVWMTTDDSDLVLVPAEGITVPQPFHDLAHLICGHRPLTPADDLALTPDLHHRAVRDLAVTFTDEQEHEAAAMQAALTDTPAP